MGIAQSVYEKPKTALRRIITSSALAEAQKDMWMFFIDTVTEKEIIPILDAVASDAGALLFLTENLTEKAEAMRKKDTSLWQKIVEKEKAYLKSGK